MGNCGVCGKEGDLVRCVVEGVEIGVCKVCSKYGKVIQEKVDSRCERKVSWILERRGWQDSDEDVVKDYSILIRHRRESLGWKQEDLAKKMNEKESVVGKVERGELKPSLKLARKFEKVLGVKLVEWQKMDNEKAWIDGGQLVTGGTIGDFVKVKKK